MRLAIPLTYAASAKEGADQVVAFERAGADIVWVAEAYGFDAPSQLGYLAARTERIQLGAGILPIYSRTPALIAQTAAGIDALSGGRMILGLGASGPQVIEGWHGVAYDRPLERTREIVDICRRVWRRETLTNDGVYHLPLPPGQGTGLGKPLKLLTRPVRSAIPIWVASLGPKNVEMTAEVADGWLPILYIPELAGRVWGESLAKGSANRSPELASLDICAGGLLAVGDDVEGLRDLARPTIALYVGGMGARGRNFYNTLVQRYGFEEEAARIQDLYLAGHKEEAAAAVPAELLEKTSLVGSEGYVKDRIAAFRDSGVTVLNVVPFDADPAGLVARVKEWLA
ncbi:MAG TPA: LLM class F420-dependent oxidoreductase [Acidimicrobiales bacterium]|nr:LLM class F420-dependent oxidoreductase [Acidimicrobiales bacterium]